MQLRKENLMMNIENTAVFVQTNDATSNQVVVFSRGEDGGLASIATHDTGGQGTGSPHLPSQGSVVVADGRVFVVNAGSDDLSVFAIAPGGLALLDRAPAGPSPRSVAVYGDLVYVLGTGGSSASASTPPGSSRRSGVPSGR
jgi:6-phosphogluconolactonase